MIQLHSACLSYLSDTQGFIKSILGRMLKIHVNQMEDSLTKNNAKCQGEV